MRVLTFEKAIIIIIITTVDVCVGKVRSGGRSRTIDANQGSSQSIAVSEDRVKLLQDALSWLMLRKNGSLLTGQELKSFEDLLLNKYKKSKYYRTLVIAFQHGVLPKLTLDVGADCKPEYTFKFKNPFNQSVTDFSIKNFTFQSYYARNNPRRMGTSAFCDYRKGLRCNPTTKKCECPPGSKMSPVGGTSTRQACLLSKEENCALMDLEHSPTHNFLKQHLPSMIFNLEKPLGCQDGLHCRIGGDGEDFDFPHCYGMEQNDDFEGGTSQFSYGRKCTLNLYTDNYGGMCEKSLTCFNFGPRSFPEKPGDFGKLGHCASDQGEFVGWGAGREVNKNGVFDVQPFVIPFVNPRTTSWVSDGHRASLTKYLEALKTANMNYFKITQQNIGGVCSLEMTKKMGEIWDFYAELEREPPSGTNFVATTNELNYRLVELMNVVAGKSKVCRINEYIAIPGGLTDNIGPALKCVNINSPVDADGNDGVCVEFPSASSTAAAKRLKKYLEYENHVRHALATEEQNYDPNILGDFPEAGCSTMLGDAEPIIAGRARHIQVDVLEGGHCPHGSVCYENLDDARGIYMENTCQFIPSYVPQPSCHDVNEGLSSFGKCEKEILMGRVMTALAGVHEHAQLGRGDTCQYDIESKIKQAILMEQDLENPYVVLNMINVGKGKGGFCDPTRLLECSEDNTCKCIKDTKPRRTDNGDTSDYCYLTKGSCKTDLKKLLPTSAVQKEMMKKQYGILAEIEASCKNGNICMFVDTSKAQCTSQNTGKTGYEGNPKLVRSMKSGCEKSGKLSFYPEIFKVLFIISISFFT